MSSRASRPNSGWPTSHGNEGQWEGIHNELVVAAQMQDAEIKATCQEIANFDYESDLAGGCQKIVGRTHRLLNSNDMLRDALQKALAEVAQQESRPPDDADRSDPLTGCVNRAGIEADLNTWWASVPDHTRLCVAMIDIDRLAGDQRAIRLPGRQRDPQGALPSCWRPTARTTSR